MDVDDFVESVTPTVFNLLNSTRVTIKRSSTLKSGGSKPNLLKVATVGAIGDSILILKASTGDVKGGLITGNILLVNSQTLIVASHAEFSGAMIAVSVTEPLTAAVNVDDQVTVKPAEFIFEDCIFMSEKQAESVFRQNVVQIDNILDRELTVISLAKLGAKTDPRLEDTLIWDGGSFGILTGRIVKQPQESAGWWDCTVSS